MSAGDFSVKVEPDSEAATRYADALREIDGMETHFGDSIPIRAAARLARWVLEGGTTETFPWRNEELEPLEP